MARNKKNQQQPKQELTGTERLGLRVTEMIGSPKAQLERRAVIHRLDSDSDEAWSAIMDLLRETSGLSLSFDSYENAVVTWEAGDEREDRDDCISEGEAAEEAAPF